jgi:hypothetical protein
MKKGLNLLIIIALLFGFSSSFALAQNNKPKPLDTIKQEREQIKNTIAERKENNLEQKELIKEDIKTRREEFKLKFEELKAKIKTEKDAKKAEILEKRILGREEALKRFDLAIERMENLKSKVNEVIAKHESKSLDVSEAKNLIAVAETKIEAAKEKTTEAYALLSGSTSQLTAEQKTQLQTLAKDTQNLIKESHNSLISAILNLKVLIKAQAENELTNSPVENETELAD